MSTGGLVRYVSSVVEGLPYRLNVFPSALIGGYGNPKSAIVGFRVEYPVSNVLLNVSVSGKGLGRGRVVWKVVLGSVTLTREFKPQVLASVDDRAYASIVFDVSQIVRGPGRYELTISCESSESIRVDEVGLVGFIPMEGSLVRINYWAGVIALQPGDEYSINLDDVEGVGRVLMVVTTPSRVAPISVKAPGRSVKVAGIIGTDEISVDGVVFGGSNNVLVVKHERSARKYFPKNVILHEILSYVPLKTGPKLRVDAREAGDGVVEVIVENTGTSVVRDAVVVGLSAGFAVFREVIRSIAPGEKAVLRFNVPKSRVKSLIVRAIYYSVWGQTVITRRLNQP